jgi:hypothetical protein
MFCSTMRKTTGDREMSWDDYTRAILRLELPEGEIEVVPGAFGRFTGTFPGNGRPVHIVTAHNPGGRLSSPDDNAVAQSRLVARVAETALEHYPAAGGDRAWEHVEPSLAVVGLDREQACALGREFGQDAIFEWSPEVLAVLSCTDARAHYTGWVSSPVMGTSGTQPSEEHAMVEDAPPAEVPQLEPESPAAELERQERAAESARRHDDWVAKLERAKLDRAAVDDGYFRVLGTRTGFLFDLRDEDSDTEIGVFGTGSTIEIRQTDYPDVLIADIAKELYAVLESRFTDAVPVFTSGEWDAGDIAYTLGMAFGPPYIDGVEWSGVDMFPDDYAVPLPPRCEAPSSCLIATLQIDWVDGASFSPGSDSGNTELLRIGPIFVSRGDEWANVLKATTEDGALREFENDLPDQEGLEKTLFVESRP